MDRIQRYLLEKEGVRFGESGAILLRVFRWRPIHEGLAPKRPDAEMKEKEIRP